ncbi:MAG: hypothetical protein IV100_15120 [Myxococcales bacterium]|nr:hypothetical protein [Myxococcales bacterium]
MIRLFALLLAFMLSLSVTATASPPDEGWSPDMRQSLVSTPVIYTTPEGTELPGIIMVDWTERLSPDAAHPYFGRDVCNLMIVSRDGVAYDEPSIPRGDGPNTWRTAETAASQEPSPAQLHPAPPVVGYRPLSQESVDKMNRVKAAYNAVGAALDELANDPEADKRCIAVAKTEAQTSAMWASRSITKPGTFA